MTVSAFDNGKYGALVEYFPDFAPYLTATTPKKCVKRAGRGNEAILYQLLQTAKHNTEHWAVDSNARSLVRTAYLFLKKSNPDLNDFCGELKPYITQTGLTVGPLPDAKGDFLKNELDRWYKNCKRKIKVLKKENGSDDQDVKRLKDSKYVISEMIGQLYLKHGGFLIALDPSGTLQGVAQVDINHKARELCLLATNPHNLPPYYPPYDGARKVNGVGSSLIAYITRISKDNKHELHLKSYRSARKFYEHLGFDRCSQRRRLTHYRLPLDKEKELRKNYLYRFTKVRDMSSVAWVPARS